MKGVAVPLQSGFSLGTPNEGTRETKRSMPCAAVQVVLLLDGEREREEWAQLPYSIRA